MSYYPEGVTGFEYEIAGPDSEYEAERLVYCTNDNCSDFEKERDVMVQLTAYRYTEWGTWRCVTCNAVNDYDGDVPEESDY